MEAVEGAGGRDSPTGAQLLERTEALAVAHRGFSTLTRLCELNGDPTHLHAHMLRCAQLLCLTTRSAELDC